MPDQPDPNKEPAVGAPALLRLPLKVFVFLLVTAIALPLWPVYWLSCLVWPRPPTAPRLSQMLRYLRLTWQIHPPAPGMTVSGRIWLTLSILQKMIATPFAGLAWQLDELLYGRALDQTQVREPIFVVSAGRSGSTQISRYIEEDPRLAVPNLLQCMFPYRWLWKLAPRTLGRMFTKEQVSEKIHATMPPELLERHEADPFRADTFDGSFYSFHYYFLALILGPQVAVEDFNFARVAAHDRGLKDDLFVALVDRLARKTLLDAGPLPDGSPRRFFIKGHFLFAADALARRYPDASFVTLVRDPAARLQSGINFLRVNPANSGLGPVPWAWLSAALSKTEREYGLVEQAWFTQSDGPRRCVICFDEFVHDLRGAMRRVYRICFDEEALPAHVPQEHPPRERKNYTVNRSLAELGIDEVAFRASLAEYIAWCQS